jgi:hypothetical protein
LKHTCDLLFSGVPSSHCLLRIEDQSYVCHSGSQAVCCCSFDLQAPTRAKILPYSYLLCIDLLGDCLITLRYSFADVEISVARDFPGRSQFIDDLANFRVSHVRDSRYLKIRVLMEQNSERTATY